MFKMFSHVYYYYHYCRRTQNWETHWIKETDLLQTHPGERNSIGGFWPFQTPNSGFLFSRFFFPHRPGTPVKSLSIKGNAALNDGTKVCYSYQSITHYWGRHFHFMLPDFALHHWGRRFCSKIYLLATAWECTLKPFKFVKKEEF